MLRIINIAVTLVLFVSVQAWSKSFFDYPVIDISNNHAVTLSVNDSVTAVMFFEPDCSWCFKQVKVFNQFLSQCDSTMQFLGLGVNGSRQALKKEVWRMQAKFPMHKASAELLTDLGQVSSTPFTLLLGAQQEVLASAKGYLNLSKWLAFINSHAGISPVCKF